MARVIPNWVTITDPSGQLRPPQAEESARESQPREVQAGGSAVDEILPLVYGGPERMGGMVYYVTATADLYLVLIFCEGEIEMIADVYVNDLPAPAGSVVATYMGTQTQPVDPTIKAINPAWDDALLGVAYAVMRFTTAMNVKGFPRVTAAISGRKVLDPRSSTVAFSDNPALCLADYIETFCSQPVNSDSTKHAADFCEANGFKLSLSLREKTVATAWADVLRQYVPALLVDSDGMVNIVPDESTPVTRAFNRDTIQETPLPKLIKRGYAELPNVVEVEWTNADVVPAVKNVTTVGTFGGGALYARKARIALPGIQNQDMAQKFATLRLAHYRYETIEGEVCIFDEGVAVLPGDVVSIVEPTFGWDSPRAVRVIAVTEKENGRYMLRFRLYDDSIYSWISGPVVGDDFFGRVVLLLHGNGEDGTSNFIDSSGYRQRVRATTQPGVFICEHDTAQKKFGPSSILYNAQGVAMMTVDARGVFSLGDTYTVEFWLRPVSLTPPVWGAGQIWPAQVVIYFGKPGNSDFLGFQFRPDGGFEVGPFYQGRAQFSSGAGVVVPNEWHHYAFSCEAGMMIGYKDGVAFGMAPVFTQVGGTSPEIEIARGFVGHIDDLRVTRGVARYPTAFTPPTAQFPSLDPDAGGGGGGGPVDPLYENVALLLHMDGDQDSTTFVDASANAFALTVTGPNFKLTQTEKQFGTASAVCSASRLATTASTEFGFGALDDFTIETWLRMASFPAYTCIVSKPAIPASSVPMLWFGLIADKLALYFPTNPTIVASAGCTPNAWHHVVLQRRNGIHEIYLDGVKVGSNAVAINWGTAAQQLMIGTNADAIDAQALTGWLDDFRVTKKFSRYSGTFTPPVAEFPSVGPAAGSGDPNFVDVSMLLHMEGAEDSTTFVDSSLRANTFTLVGTGAKLTQLEKKIGTASARFSSSHITTPASQAFAFGQTDDFTVEGFFRPATLPGYATIISMPANSGQVPTVPQFWIGTKGANLVLYYPNNPTITASATLVANTWYHIVLQRRAGVHELYQDGALVGSTAVVINWGTPNTSMRIGANATGGEFFDGWVDEIRVTKGVARYSAPFTVPTEAYPDQ
jgi:hypothetical protein